MTNKDKVLTQRIKAQRELKKEQREQSFNKMIDWNSSFQKDDMEFLVRKDGKHILNPLYGKKVG